MRKEIIFKLYQASLSLPQIADQDFWIDRVGRRFSGSLLKGMRNYGGLPQNSKPGISGFLYALQVYNHESDRESSFDSSPKLPSTSLDTIFNIVIAPRIEDLDPDRFRYPDSLYD